jgi:SH3-like domain-containing protein
VAPADAYVVRVGFDRLGGKIVWLRDPARELRYYYAHLDQQLVTTGDFVPSGGTVGLVGNTGNAITSKPHLHFGIYDGDAIDPVPFVELPRFRAVEVSADIELIGEWARVSDRSTRLRKGPTASSDVERTLDRETTVRVIGAIDHWYRVCLPDGASGYLGARSIERLGKPIEAIAVAQAGVLRRRPDPTAPAIAAVDAAAQLSVLGRFGPYLYVSSPDHRPGWLLIP